ncbi:MAG: type III pantothenate kinase [Proteobacteria bacterium]|nr:type III pantothenate kinase [Pseudomonadota bacterium]
MPTILAIDSGNSFVKWGFYENDHWLMINIIGYETIYCLKDEFSKLSDPDVIIISHVARRETRNEIYKMTSHWNSQIIWFQSSSSHCGVKNGYLNPKQLGSDRWAALIAAWKIQHEACLVINVGTAVTIDALSDSGQFLGGIILPGAHLMLNSLHAKTQLNQMKAGVYEDFPDNTNDAIQSGIIHCLIGAIERMHDLLSKKINHTVQSCVISGGGSSFLLPFIKYPINAIDNLVLEGLILIAKDHLNRNSAIPKDK